MKEEEEPLQHNWPRGLSGEEQILEGVYLLKEKSRHGN